MKQLLYTLAISLVVISCSKSAPSAIDPVSISGTAAFDSMSLSPNTVYHMVFNRNNMLDSNYCIRFNSATSFTEYHSSTDTNGVLHLLDSLTYADTKSNSIYQQADPLVYVSTIGYVYTNYYPINDTIAEDSIGHNPNYVPAFPFHNYLNKDTLHLYMGTALRYYTPVGTFKHAVTDSPDVVVTFYR